MGKIDSAPVKRMQFFLTGRYIMLIFNSFNGRRRFLANLSGVFHNRQDMSLKLSNDLLTHEITILNRGDAVV
ncbi:hypothetical protein AAH450_04690 [Erwinia sp. P7711]|uniref:hypothetical protein n=1 Tax=Erwinia sp. P7711 TaxID=3141451 RepID=UPI00318D0F65